MICLAEINGPKCPQHPESMLQLQSLQLSHFHPPVRLHVAHVGRYLAESTSWGCDSHQVNSVYPTYGVVTRHRVEDADDSRTCQTCQKPHDGDKNLRVVLELWVEGCLKVNVRLGHLSPNSQVSVTLRCSRSSRGTAHRTIQRCSSVSIF